MKHSFIYRIKLLYTILKESPQDINGIKELYRKEDINVLKRQIYRDLDYLQTDFLQEEEQLLVIRVDAKKRAWAIKSKITISQEADPDLLYGYQVFENHFPLYLENKIKSSLCTDFKSFFHSKFNNAKQLLHKLKLTNEAPIKNTHFFEKFYTKEDFEKFKTIHWSIVNKRKLRIEKIKLDTAFNPTQDFPLSFIPIKFIFHRGNIYCGGMNYKKKVLVYDLMEIIDYRIGATTVKNHEEVANEFESEMSKRFGITKNIDQNIYEIVLEFTPSAGEFASTFMIHSSQKFFKSDNSFFLHLRCGINYELIGWIMSWMNEIKIVSPYKLKELYNYTLIKMMRPNDTSVNHTKYDLVQ